MLFLRALWFMILGVSGYLLGINGQTETVTYDDARVQWTPSILSADKTQNCFKDAMEPAQDPQCLGVWVKTDDVAWLQPWSGIHGIASQVSLTQTSVSLGFTGSQVQVFGGSFLMPGFTIGVGVVTIDNQQHSVNFSTSLGPVFKSGTLDNDGTHELKVDFAKFSASAFVYIDHFVVFHDAASSSPSSSPKISVPDSSGQNSQTSRETSFFSSSQSSTSLATTTTLASSEVGPSTSVTGLSTLQSNGNSESLQPSSSSLPTTTISTRDQKSLSLGGRVGIAISAIVVLLALITGLVLIIRRRRQRLSKAVVETAPYNLYSNNSLPPVYQPKCGDAVKAPQRRDSDSYQVHSPTLSQTGSTDSGVELVALQSAMTRAGLSTHALMALLRAPRQQDAEQPPNYEG